MIYTLLALAVGLQAPQGGDSDWKTYTSKAGFSVMMPGVVAEQKQQLPGLGETLMAMAKDGPNVYLVMKIRNPKPVPKAAENTFFKEIAEATAKAAPIVSQKVIALAGHPGREYVLEKEVPGAETLVMTSRYILMSPELTYNLQIIRSKASPVPPAAEMARFFDSLKLVAAANAPAEAGRNKLEFQPFSPPGAGFATVMPGKPKETRVKAGAGPVRSPPSPTSARRSWGLTPSPSSSTSRRWAMRRTR